jgi:hypothetical protein
MTMRSIGLALFMFFALACGDGSSTDDRDAGSSEEDDGGRRRRDAGCMEAVWGESSFDRACFGR